MEFFVVVPVVIAVVALIGTIAYFHHLKERKRREALAQLAARNGLRFDASKSDPPACLREMADFARGHSRYAYNTLSGPLRLGEATLEVRMGDYHFAVTRSNGKSTTTQHYNFSYLAVRCGRPGAPRVTVRREGFFDSISAAFGFNDIDFESAEFSRLFHVSASDKRFAYDLIHPRTIELLLADSPNRLDMRGEWLCVTDRDRRWDPPEFERWNAWLARFVDLWPDHLDDLPTLTPQETVAWKA